MVHFGNSLPVNWESQNFNNLLVRMLLLENLRLELTLSIKRNIWALHQSLCSKLEHTSSRRFNKGITALSVISPAFIRLMLAVLMRFSTIGLKQSIASFYEVISSAFILSTIFCMTWSFYSELSVPSTSMAHLNKSFILWYSELPGLYYSSMRSTFLSVSAENCYCYSSVQSAFFLRLIVWLMTVRYSCTTLKGRQIESLSTQLRKSMDFSSPTLYNVAILSALGNYMV